MKLFLDPERADKTVLGYESFECLSFGYDEGRLETIVGIARGNHDGKPLAFMVAVEGPELYEDLLLNYVPLI